MKIGIHHNPGSFSDRWIEYCKKNKIDFKIVDCYRNDIIQQLEDCDALMWHHNQANYKDVIFAKQLLFAVEQSGKKVFPDFKTNWYFDDKVGQKYLFESIDVPFVSSYIFYEKNQALDWINKTAFPKVLKLRGGAGSENVRLIHNRSQAKNLIKKAFNSGFPAFDSINNLRERKRKYNEKKTSIKDVVKGVLRFFFPSINVKMRVKEKGYVLFQEFIPNNKFDIRVIVIDNKAFAIKRMVRNGDFRASGSGSIKYDYNEIPIKTIELAFKVTDKIQSQCAAIDFVFNHNGEPLILEVSFGFVSNVYDKCVGYWDKNLQFHEGTFIPQNWMIELLINNKF